MQTPISEVITTAVDVGFDPGNARTDVIISQPNSTPIRVSFPSARSLHGAFSYELFAARRLAPGSWKQLGAADHILSVGGVERFIGDLALGRASAASTARGSDTRYSDGFTLDLLLTGLAAALPKTNHITARVSTGVPAELWVSLAGQVERALLGTHAFQYNGRAVTVVIEQVSIEREGAAIAALLDARQKIGRTLIIDGGGRTVNLALLQDGEVKAAKTLEIGVETALDDLDRSLIGQGLRALTLQERYDLVNALATGERFQLSQRGSTDITEQARMYLRAGAQALITELYSKVRVESADSIIGAGGIVYHYGEAVAQAIAARGQTITYLPEPEHANALAYLTLLAGAPAKKARKR